MKLKPCSSANYKHRWSHIRNTTRTLLGFSPAGTSASMSLVGIYKCVNCGQRKSGKWRPADQPSLV